jgi:hypothetical protein
MEAARLSDASQAQQARIRRSTSSGRSHEVRRIKSVRIFAQGVIATSAHARE